MLPILTQPKMDSASSEKMLLLPMLDTEASILPKEMKSNLLKDSTMLDLLQYLSKSLTDSADMFQVFIQSIIAELAPWM